MQVGTSSWRSTAGIQHACKAPRDRPCGPRPARLAVVAPVQVATGVLGDAQRSVSNSSASINGMPSRTPGAQLPTNVPKDTTKGMTAAEKLNMLAHAKARSTTALQSAAYNPYTKGAALGAGVDLKVYQNALDSQKRLNEKLSENAKYISYLERRVESTEATAETASIFLKQMAMEFGTTSRLAEAAAAAMRFGVDKEEAVEKLLKLHERLRTMERAVQRERLDYGKKVVTRVPISWVGVAQEVKLMGDFDGWTRGYELSAANIDTDSVYRSFEGHVPLLPGEYRVKLLVDGQWKPADAWPTETDSVGETNNVLRVDVKTEALAKMV